jgi:hypothetical protein
MEMLDEGLIKPACSSGKRRKAEKLITASSAELLYLAQHFIDEGIINAEQSGDLERGSDAAVYGVDNSCSKI